MKLRGGERSRIARRRREIGGGNRMRGCVTEAF